MTTKRLIEETLPLPSDQRRVRHRQANPRRAHLHDARLVGASAPAHGQSRGSRVSNRQQRDDAAEAEKQIEQAMATKGLPSNQGIKWLRERISAIAPGGPKVLDCFAGGGAIPLEALRLGCNTTAMDLNPVAYLIELACLDYPQRYRDNDTRGRNALVVDVQRWADWTVERTRRTVDRLYPIAEGQSGPAPYYFWVRTMPSPDPNLDAEIPILSSRLLASARRSAWVTTSAGPDGVDIDVHQGELPNDPTLQGGLRVRGQRHLPHHGHHSTPARRQTARPRQRFRLPALRGVRH